MQLNNFTTHPKFGQNEPFDLGLICSSLMSTAFFKQTDMGLLAIQILKDAYTLMCLLFSVLKFILKDKLAECIRSLIYNLAVYFFFFFFDVIIKAKA